jgi:hypothetical protein
MSSRAARLKIMSSCRKPSLSSVRSSGSACRSSGNKRAAGGVAKAARSRKREVRVRLMLRLRTWRLRLLRRQIRHRQLQLRLLLRRRNSVNKWSGLVEIVSTHPSPRIRLLLECAFVLFDVGACARPAVSTRTGSGGPTPISVTAATIPAARFTRARNNANPRCRAAERARSYDI